MSRALQWKCALKTNNYRNRVLRSTFLRVTNEFFFSLSSSTFLSMNFFFSFSLHITLTFSKGSWCNVIHHWGWSIEYQWSRALFSILIVSIRFVRKELIVVCGLCWVVVCWQILRTRGLARALFQPLPVPFSSTKSGPKRILARFHCNCKL